LSLVFKTVHEIFFSFPGLSQICKIRNAWFIKFILREYCDLKL
jgi:hypothetical protein